MLSYDKRAVDEKLQRRLARSDCINNLTDPLMYQCDLLLAASTAMLLLKSLTSWITYDAHRQCNPVRLNSSYFTVHPIVFTFK